MRFADEPSGEKPPNTDFTGWRRLPLFLCDNCNESVDIKMSRCYSIDTN
ncbi:hypothetical protein CHCC20335_4617 [Bacillus paralicheniformis]|nr:hypothetical protein CHCC20335_4617 [Bacillus paralicheniformis]